MTDPEYISPIIKQTFEFCLLCIHLAIRMIFSIEEFSYFLDFLDFVPSDVVPGCVDFLAKSNSDSFAETWPVSDVSEVSCSAPTTFRGSA